MATQKRHSFVFVGKNRLKQITEPMPSPKAGELLVQTTRSLISTGTESICFTRNFAPGTGWAGWVKYPFRPGYLNAGRIIKIGPKVTGWKVGDRVVSRSPHTSHSIVSAESAIRVPDNVSDEDAAWMGLGKITQVGVRAAQHQMGDVVVIIGLGLLGQLVTQYVRLMGAKEIIAIDTAPMRLEMAAAHGATRTLQMTAAQAFEPIKQITGGRGADVVYDITGHHAVFPTALPLARKFGTVVLLGDTGQPHLQTLTHDLINRGLRVVGAHDVHAPEVPNEWNNWSVRNINELFLTYVSRGQIKLSDLITHRFKPRQAAEVYPMLQVQRETAMGVIFEWT